MAFLPFFLPLTQGFSASGLVPRCQKVLGPENQCVRSNSPLNAWLPLCTLGHLLVTLMVALTLRSCALSSLQVGNRGLWKAGPDRCLFMR